MCLLVVAEREVSDKWALMVSRVRAAGRVRFQPEQRGSQAAMQRLGRQMGTNHATVGTATDIIFDKRINERAIPLHHIIYIGVKS